MSYVTSVSGAVQVRSSIYRKPAAKDVYLPADSYHPRACKLGVAKGEAIRYLTRCMDKRGFDAAWERLSTALQYRGYTRGELEKAKGVKWGDRQEVQDRMDEKARVRKQEGGAGGGKKGESMMMVSWKPGVKEWWREAHSGGLLTEWRGWGEEVPELVTLKILQCARGTQTLGQLLGKKGAGRGDGRGQGGAQGEGGMQPRSGANERANIAAAQGLLAGLFDQGSDNDKANKAAAQDLLGSLFGQD